MSPVDREKLHERGERIIVRWPGGPYDFVIEFSYAESGRDDWLTIHGLCVDPEGPQDRTMRSFYFRQVEGEERTYALLPELER